ncbi:FAD-dependent oxidoreductase [Thermophilibacter mediterraneus]|uniref:oxidoreductase n=1 Tax=Thermophilibacter mediterraneus TaxID=1871031 RepID=UPI002353CCE7|nr:FAD-dependent oxidoreductase [Thermophilibacter mediterraneus]
MKLDTLFSPLMIGSCEIPNRLVVPAMVTNYCNLEGTITERYLRYMEEKAKGGWGLLITEDYCVQEGRKGYTRIPGLWNEGQVAGNRELTDAVHAHGSKIFCQMYHPGRQVMPQATCGLEVVAPSATTCPACQALAREMSVEEIHQLVSDFGAAAGRAERAGFDGVELHCAHGYLLAEFLSPAVNRRVDEYGGCFENRVRIVDEIIGAMRAQTGPDFAITVRISSDDLVPGGRTIAETLQLCRHLEEVGFDAINCSNGMYASAPTDQVIAPMFTPHALNMERSALIKQVVSIPVILSNRVNDPEMADTLLKMGVADFVAMGRGSLADPHLPRKAACGKVGTIRQCIGCLQGCEAPLYADEAVTCVVNPRVGREHEADLAPVDEPRRVMVIGGGPAGLQAAEAAARRGHAVEVFEAQGQLGGQFRSAAYPVGKGELATYVSSLRASLEELGVPVHLGCEATEKLIADEKPDAVVIATGARPLTPPIPGIENAVAAEDVLLGRAEVRPGPVVVCGGGEVGAETADFVARYRDDVSVLEMRDDLCLDMMPITKQVLMGMLGASGVKAHVGATVKRIETGVEVDGSVSSWSGEAGGATAATGYGVVYEDAEGVEHTLPAATVISAFGYKAHNPLEEVARRHCDDVRVIGSAVRAGNALVASREGYEAGLAV